MSVNDKLKLRVIGVSSDEYDNSIIHNTLDEAVGAAKSYILEGYGNPIIGIVAIDYQSVYKVMTTPEKEKVIAYVTKPSRSDNEKGYDIFWKTDTFFYRDHLRKSEIHNRVANMVYVIQKVNHEDEKVSDIIAVVYTHEQEALSLAKGLYAELKGDYNGVIITKIKEEEISGSLEDSVNQKHPNYVIMYDMVHTNDEDNYLTLFGDFYTMLQKLDG